MKKTNDALNSINGETTAAPCPACLLTSTYQGRLEINRFAVFFLWPRLTGPEPVVGVGGGLCSSSLLVYQSSVITPPASGWRLVWQLMHRLAGTGTQSSQQHSTRLKLSTDTFFAVTEMWPSLRAVTGWGTTRPVNMFSLVRGQTWSSSYSRQTRGWRLATSQYQQQSLTTVASTGLFKI